jgi:hypothetical protein
VKRHEVIYLAVCAGVVMYAVGYLAAAFLELPVLTYFPRERAWRVVTHAGALPMPYYGLILYGLLFGINAATIVMALATHVVRHALSRVFAELCAGWAMAVLTLAAAFFTYRNWP